MTSRLPCATACVPVDGPDGEVGVGADINGTLCLQTDVGGPEDHHLDTPPDTRQALHGTRQRTARDDSTRDLDNLAIGCPTQRHPGLRATDDSPQGGQDSVSNPGEPDRACVVKSTEGRVTANGRVVIVDAETGDAYIREEKSDGTVEVTFIEEGALGASLRAGGKGKIDAGDIEGGGGGEASIGAMLEGYVGETRVFDDPAEADQFIQDRIVDEAIEALPPVVEQGAGLIRKGIDWITGHETPTGEEGSSEGGVSGKIEAKAEGAAGPITASAEAAAEAGAKVKVMPDGSMEVTLDVAVTADGNVSIVEGGVGRSGSVTVKLDGLDGVDLPAGGGVGREQTVTASLDLSDPDLAPAADDLINEIGGALDDGDLDGVINASGNLLEETERATTITGETYETDDWDLGAEASGNLGPGLGAGVHVSKADKELISASYWDPVANEFVPWISCTG